MKKSFALLLMLFSLSCSQVQPPREVLLSRVRPSYPANIKENQATINLNDYEKVLGNTAAFSALRVVSITARSGEDNPLPEYKLFGISEDSAAYFLGLRNNDILIAANGFLIYEGEKFKAYLNLLRGEKEAMIEIRRGSEPILFKYTFYK